jgi:hypothetical protein
LRISISILPFLFLTFCFTSGQSTKDSLNASKSSTLLISRDTVHLYFPLKENGQDSITNANALDTFMNIWYSKMLFALHEPILSDYDGDAEIYRFTWLRTFHNPITIRVQKKGDSINLTAKVSNGAGGYEPGQISIDKTIAVDIKVWNNIQSKFTNINFWNLPVEYDFRGTDGAEWILESATKDKYHFTTRWSPGRNSNYGKCSLYFLKLSDIKVPNDDQY